MEKSQNTHASEIPFIPSPVTIEFKQHPPRPISALDDLININGEWSELLEETQKLHSRNSKPHSHKSAHSSYVSSYVKTSRPLKQPFPTSSTRNIESLPPKKGLLANPFPWQSEWWMHFHPLPPDLISPNMSWNYSGHKLVSALQPDSRDTKPFLLDKNKKMRTPKRTLAVISKNVLEGELPEAFLKESIKARIQSENSPKIRFLEDSNLYNKAGAGSLISEKNISNLSHGPLDAKRSVRKLPQVIMSRHPIGSATNPQISSSRRNLE